MQEECFLKVFTGMLSYANSGAVASCLDDAGKGPWCEQTDQVGPTDSRLGLSLASRRECTMRYERCSLYIELQRKKLSRRQGLPIPCAESVARFRLAIGHDFGGLSVLNGSGRLQLLPLRDHD
ncbi:hypothetical protein TNCV_2197511 [Trichonephila clavipes]|nr:hypothetical protein TNCV_2197511 [Trichonephila clavipes]